MKKRIGDCNTNILLEGTEPTTICKVGQGHACCAFVVVGSEGFECVRMDYPNNSIIFSRLKSGTMNNRGRGEWESCPWFKGSKPPQPNKE